MLERYTEQTVGIMEASFLSIIDYIPQIITALCVLILMILLGMFCGNILLKFLKRSALSGTHSNFFRKIVIWVFFIIGISISLNILNLKSASMGLLTGGGITVLALGIAFRDIGENILAGVYLAFSRPFKTGDLISTEGLEGIVKEVELRHTHIRTYDGIDIFIPNAKIFNQPLLNFTMDGLRRISFTIGIDYADDAAEACSLLAKEIKKIGKVLKDPPCIVAISGFTPQYVDLKIYYWLNTFDKNTDIWNVKNGVMECCRTTLKENNFTFSSNVQTSNMLSIPEAIKITTTEK